MSVPSLLLERRLGDLSQVVRVEQHALDDLDGLLAGFRQAEQPLAAAHEELDAELVLEVLDVLADAGLRGAAARWQPRSD